MGGANILLALFLLLLWPPNQKVRFNKLEIKKISNFVKKFLTYYDIYIIINL